MITEKHLPLLLVAAEHHYVSKVSDALIEQFTTDFENHLATTITIWSFGPK